MRKKRKVRPAFQVLAFSHGSWGDDLPLEVILQAEGSRTAYLWLADQTYLGNVVRALADPEVMVSLGLEELATLIDTADLDRLARNVTSQRGES